MVMMMMMCVVNSDLRMVLASLEGELYSLMDLSGHILWGICRLCWMESSNDARFFS